MEDELTRLRTGNWRAAYENSQHALPFVDGDFMSSHHRYWFLWISFLLLAFPALTLAHDDRLTGWVEDPSGHPLHEVSVEVLAPEEFQALARTITDHQGRFSFSNLPHSDLKLTQVGLCRKGLSLNDKP